MLRRRSAAGDLDERRVQLAIRDLMDLPVTRYPHLPFAPRVWELRRSVTPYDAAYIALAEELDCVLVTADGRLSRVPDLRCGIDVVGPA